MNFQRQEGSLHTDQHPEQRSSCSSSSGAGMEHSQLPPWASESHQCHPPTEPWEIKEMFLLSMGAAAKEKGTNTELFIKLR